MKRIVCKPAPELEVVLSGGEVILLRFDLNSLEALQSMEGGLAGVFKKGKKSITELAALIVYAAAKNNNENMDFDKARFIVSEMNVNGVTELVNEYIDAMGIEKNEAQSDYAKKLMAQFIESLK